MPSLGTITKYLGVLSIGKGIIDKAIIQKLLTGIAAVAALSVFAGMLVGAIFLGIIYAAYHALLTQAELGTYESLAIVGIVVAAVAAFVISKVVGFIKKISMAAAVLSQPTTPTSVVQDVIQSFLNGFSSQSNQPAPNNLKKNLKTVK